jgi:hypothetical protein
VGYCCHDLIGIVIKNYHFMLTKRHIALLHEYQNSSCEYCGHTVVQNVIHLIIIEK